MKKLITILITMVLLFSFGCQAEPQEDFFAGEGLLSTEEIERYVSLFEQDLSVFKEETSLTDSEITKHERHRGIYLTTVSRKFGEQEFELQLLTDSTKDPETLYCYQYLLTFAETDAAKAYEMGADIAVKARDLYGEPDTYPIAPGRIFTEDGELIEGGTNEIWEVGEIEFQINVYPAYEQEGSAVQLRYTKKNPRTAGNSSYKKS